MNIYGDCFRCDPSPRLRDEKPWQWSAPRALCNTHVTDLELEDGLPLMAALHRVRPDGYQLEGSLLGWLFNPVFYRVGAVRQRVWAAFVAGGILGLEDRFDARNHFEAWAFEHPAIVDLLYGLRRLPPHQRHSTFDALIGAATLEKNASPPALQDSQRGAMQGYGRAAHAWNFELTLKATREANGRLWPQSHEELLRWLHASPPSETPLPGTEDTLLRELGALAGRRISEESLASWN